MWYMAMRKCAEKKTNKNKLIKLCIKVPVELCIIQPPLQLEMGYHVAITGGHPTTDNGSHLFLFVQARVATDTLAVVSCVKREQSLNDVNQI